VEAGADGLVLFNRFYQPDFDLDELEVVPNLLLSTSSELRLPLRWIALLYGRVHTDYALTSGVHSATDMLKAMMAGASVSMVTSEFLQNGIDRAGEMLAGCPLLDGRTRIRIDHADAGQHERSGGCPTQCLQKNELYESALFLQRIKRASLGLNLGRNFFERKGGLFLRYDAWVYTPPWLL
jgi:hypothetical protein